MQDFKKLKVWQKAHQLVLSVYSASKKFPRVELFALTDQFRRAAFSIAANTAEGSGRRSRKEFTYFLGIALGSVSEVEYSLILAKDLNYLAVADFQSMQRQADEVRRMLISLIKKIEGTHT